MIDFLYYGEANVYQENLDSFLAVAEELQLKGLMGSGAEKDGGKLFNNSTMKKTSPKQEEQRSFSKQELQDPTLPCSLDKALTFPHQERTLAVTDYTVAADLQDLDDRIKSMMEVSENVDERNRKNRICKVCGKEGSMYNIQKHIEANHIT